MHEYVSSVSDTLKVKIDCKKLIIFSARLYTVLSASYIDFILMTLNNFLEFSRSLVYLLFPYCIHKCKVKSLEQSAVSYKPLSV